MLVEDICHENETNEVKLYETKLSLNIFFLSVYYDNNYFM